mmetsp:Transcript_23720/g.68230  ORF Transcript_23720/g.68230 Transcript_23720/m.68230 type:complete len:284 (+) Transcript_23720:444-1295(+)
MSHRCGAACDPHARVRRRPPTAEMAHGVVQTACEGVLGGGDRRAKCVLPLVLDRRDRQPGPTHRPGRGRVRGDRLQLGPGLLWHEHRGHRLLVGALQHIPRCVLGRLGVRRRRYHCGIVPIRPADHALPERGGAARSRFTVHLDSHPRECGVHCLLQGRIRGVDAIRHALRRLGRDNPSSDIGERGFAHLQPGLHVGDIRRRAAAGRAQVCQRRSGVRHDRPGDDGLQHSLARLVSRGVQTGDLDEFLRQGASSAGARGGTAVRREARRRGAHWRQRCDLHCL